MIEMIRHYEQTVAGHCGATFEAPGLAAAIRPNHWPPGERRLCGVAMTMKSAA